MKTYTKIHRLLLGVFAVAALAAFAASPALGSSGVSQHVKLKAHKRAHRLARGGAQATETAGVSSFGAIKAAAKEKPEEKETSGSCPKPTNLETATNVGASVKTNGTVDTYSFESFEKKEVSPGVPGLMKYCVYPDPTVSAPTAVAATYPGWLASKAKKGANNFSFSRPGGNATNIPYDETSHEVGTATWSTTAPDAEEQTIVLHINDASQCQTLYKGSTAETCFVLPGEPPLGVCEKGTGNTEAAYNSIPIGFPACAPAPSFAFEGNFASEFGDMVEAGAGGEVEEMIVDFQSYGCATSGHWNTGNCKTEAPDPSTFTIPGGITASIYKENGSGEPVYPAAATATINPNIPFRPSWDETNCTGENVGKFVGPAGVCVNSESVLLHFPFTSGSVSVGEKVFWTVHFNTSNAGYPPIGNETECREVGNPGCGYDSLNVGTRTYTNSPYAGADVADTAWVDFGIVEPGNLETISLTCPECGPGLETAADLRPLGEIILK